jgi:Mrp family chromosome partitioning ATPase
MSTLDKAFIKAYHRPQRRIDAPAAEAAAASRAVSASPAVPLSRALAGLNAAHAAGTATSTATAERVSTSLGAMLDEALQEESLDTSLPQADEPVHAPTTARQKPASFTSRIQQPATTRAPEQPTAIAKTAAPTVAAPAVIALVQSVPAPSVQLPPLPVQNVTIGSAAAENTWSPLLQVDRVVWPTIHNRLQGAAKAAIALMTDGLQSIGDSGRKIIGLTSCARGEGVTTLLSAAARNLLERGRRVAIVDSHWENPQLARSLGLLPQIGWEEALSGGLPLEEIVIESLADGLAVLPVREPPASVITKAAIGASLQTLAAMFDFVLVDLGPLGDIADTTSPAHAVARHVDAVVLVQNVRVTPPNRLAEIHKRLAESNMRYAGTIQNFVAG